MIIICYSIIVGLEILQSEVATLTNTGSSFVPPLPIKNLMNFHGFLVKD